MTADRQPAEDNAFPDSIDYNHIFDSSVYAGIRISLFSPGFLEVSTGRLAAFDPLSDPEPELLQRSVSPGRYPLKIYIAHTVEMGDRYAVAKLEFSPAKAVRWEFDQPGEIDPDWMSGFAVDAGLGAFADSAALRSYKQLLDKFYSEHPKGNIYEDLFEDEFRKNATEPDEDGDWMNFRIPGTAHNILMFHSGLGDGYFPVYWGISADDKIVSLIIDFQVFESLEQNDK